MLDSHSLEVISRFKQSVLSKSLPGPAPDIGTASRGNKIQPANNSENTLTPKVVEYEGSTHLVLTNNAIEKSTYRNRRKWHEMYGENDESGSDEYGDEDDENSDDEHPFKKLKLTELLSPLSHPSEVISHPAILKTYQLNIFNKLASELIDSIELEQNNLNWLNKLLQVLNGEDWFFLLEENLGLLKYDHGLNDETNNATSDNGVSKAKKEDLSESKHATSDEQHQEEKDESGRSEELEEPSKRITRTSTSQNEKESNEVTDPFFALPEALAKYEAHQAQQVDESSDELLVIQEDLINYLQVSIQRQQEYIKNLTQIRNGLVRAERLKQNLNKWGKEMYDKKSS